MSWACKEILISSEVAAKTGLNHIDVGQLTKENNFYEGWGEQYDCPVLDEDKVHGSIIPEKETRSYIALLSGDR